MVCGDVIVRYRFNAIVTPFPQTEFENGDVAYDSDEFPLQAFYDYQMQQMTSTFIDQFGFTADQFTGDDEKPE